MDRAIDNVSGRLTKPMVLTEENAWRKTSRYNWNNGNGAIYTYYWVNMLSGRDIPITEEEYRTQVRPSL